MRQSRVVLSLLIAFVLLSGHLQAQQKSIVQTAIDAGSFNTLVTAVKAAGLVDTLSRDTQFTVFADRRGVRDC